MERDLHFGVNLNNREPLLVAEYDLQSLLELAVSCEDYGFDSVWLGDSLLSRPRWEPVSLLSAISQRTRRVQLGTAIMVATVRNPIWLAAEWATLDQLSNGRSILGVGVGSTEASVRAEFAALGYSFKDRLSLFEECMDVTRQLLSKGNATLQGRHHQLDKVGFSSGSETVPMLPIQQPPPIWIASNPRIKAGVAEDLVRQRMEQACARIIKLGDGWITCCRARHPQEVSEQLGMLKEMAAQAGRDPDSFRVAYQVTMHLGDSREKAQSSLEDYISAYYPELSQQVDMSEWGPVGTADDIAEWIETFAGVGVDTFICRFAAADQAAQLGHFASEVLPRFKP